MGGGRASSQEPSQSREADSDSGKSLLQGQHGQLSGQSPAPGSEGLGTMGLSLACCLCHLYCHSPVEDETKLLTHPIDLEGP